MTTSSNLTIRLIEASPKLPIKYGSANEFSSFAGKGEIIYLASFFDILTI
jgi:hypothetical protein